jgi:hypothetical protein
MLFKLHYNHFKAAKVQIQKRARKRRVPENDENSSPDIKSSSEGADDSSDADADQEGNGDVQVPQFDLGRSLLDCQKKGFESSMSRKKYVTC